MKFDKSVCFVAVTPRYVNLYVSNVFAMFQPPDALTCIPVKTVAPTLPVVGAMIPVIRGWASVSRDPLVAL